MTPTPPAQKKKLVKKKLRAFLTPKDQFYRGICFKPTGKKVAGVERKKKLNLCENSDFWASFNSEAAICHIISQLPHILTCVVNYHFMSTRHKISH